VWYFVAKVKTSSNTPLRGGSGSSFSKAAFSDVLLYVAICSIGLNRTEFWGIGKDPANRGTGFLKLTEF